MDPELINHIASLDINSLESVLLLLEPTQLDQVCRSNVRINHLCQDSNFKLRYEQAQYRSIKEEYPLEPGLMTRGESMNKWKKGIEMAGILGSERLFNYYFNSLDEVPLLKIALIQSALKGAAQYGSPRFALRLLDFLKEYIIKAEPIIQENHLRRGTKRAGRPLTKDEITSFVKDQLDDELLKAEQDIVESLVARGDLDSALQLAHQFKVDPNWVIMGLILGGQEDFAEIASQLDITINARLLEIIGTQNAVKSKNSEMIYVLSSYDPTLADYIGEELLRVNQWDRFVEFRTRYPFVIKLFHLVLTISNGNFEAFNQLLPLTNLPTERSRWMLLNDVLGLIKSDPRFLQLTVSFLGPSLINTITWGLSRMTNLRNVDFLLRYLLDQDLITTDDLIRIETNLRRQQTDFKTLNSPAYQLILQLISEYTPK